MIRADGTSSVEVVTTQDKLIVATDLSKSGVRVSVTAADKYPPRRVRIEDVATGRRLADMTIDLAWSLNDTLPAALNATVPPKVPAPPR